VPGAARPLPHGQNTYSFANHASDGSFVVTDFMPSSDTVLLSGYTCQDLPTALADRTHSGDNTTITFQNVGHGEESWFG